MNALPDHENVTALLADALAADRLTGRIRDAGERLLEHLQQPTVIVVAGLTGSGKTSLINMLARENLMPSIAGVPISELAWGAKPKVITEMHDGRVLSFDGTLDQATFSADAMRVRVETPAPALRDRTFIEVSLPEQQDIATDFLDWGLERADVAIWCTQNFDDREYVLWASAPEHLKDRSFLVLSRADQLHMKGLLTRRIADIDGRAGEEFYGLYPVATLQALAALSGDHGAGSSLMEGSGGLALSRGLEHQILSGRMADMDQARVLLDRAGAGHRPEPVKEAPKSAPAPAAGAASAGASADVTDLLAITDALAERLCPKQGYLPGPSPAAVLSACVTALSDLTEFVETDAAQESLSAELCEEIFEAEQLVGLFMAENSASAAEDALALMLQLRREIHAETIQ